MITEFSNMLFPKNDEQLKLQNDLLTSQLTNRQITSLILQEWRNSQTILDMDNAYKYYLVKNTKIKQKTRSYVDDVGNVYENETISNVKVPSAFLRKAVNQKRDYAFGKPFVVSVQKKDGETLDVLGKTYSTEINNILNVDFRKTIKALVKNAINMGVGFIYPYIDSEGNFKITNTDPRTIYPQWKDSEHTILDALVRDYYVNDFSENSVKLVNKIEYWTPEAVEKFVYDSGYLYPDLDQGTFDTDEAKDFAKKQTPEIRPHMTLNNNGEIVGLGWGRVPFIALKGDEDELPLLNLIKGYIDAFDMLYSKSVDTLVDDIDPVLVVKNISPSIGDLARARDLLKKCRMMSVDADGDAQYLQVKTDITSVDAKLEQTKNLIREFSHTVDTQDVKLGSNPSGISLKSMYQDLDTYTNGLELEFESFIKNLKYFVDKYLEFKGVASAEQLSQYNITVTLDRDMMINTSQLIDDVSKLQGLVSQQTLDEYNPAIESHEIEQKRREEDRKLLLSQSEEFQFQQVQTNVPMTQEKEE